MIEVRHMGTMEVPAPRKRRDGTVVPGYRTVDAWTVVVNGLVRYPWTTKREALAEKRRLEKESKR